MDHTSSNQLTKGIILEPSVKFYFQLFEIVYTHTQNGDQYERSRKHLFNNRGFVCVTETPTGVDLLWVLERTFRLKPYRVYM